MQKTPKEMYCAVKRFLNYSTLKLIVLIVFLIPIVVFKVPSANSVEPCLSNLPDSHWNSGYPDIYPGLYPGIQQRVTGNSAEEIFLGGSKIMTLTYEYIGPNCSLRTIKTQYELSVGFKVLTDEEILDMSQKFDLWNPLFFKETIDKYRNLPRFGKAAGWTNLNLGNSSKIGLLRIPTIQSLYGFIPWSEFKNKCAYFGTDHNRPFNSILYGRIGDTPIKINSQPCELDIKLVSQQQPNLLNFGNGNWFESILFTIKRRQQGELDLVTQYEAKWNPVSRKLEIVYKVIDLNKFNISLMTSSKTITCTKGKLKKIVSGLNPKCPAGYNMKTT